MNSPLLKATAFLGTLIFAASINAADPAAPAPQYIVPPAGAAPTIIPAGKDGIAHIDARKAATTAGTPGSAGKKSGGTAAGVWKWTTLDGNQMPVENTLTLSVDKKGKITGILIDQVGQHELKDVTLGDGVATFDLKVHARGMGDFVHSFTVSLDPANPAVTEEEPSMIPAEKAAGKKRHHDHAAKYSAGP